MALLKIEVDTRPLALSHTAAHALAQLETYDIVAFTSKKARAYFDAELRRRKLRMAKTVHILHVGPRKDLLKHPIDNKRVLFPRSTIAPTDVLRDMRERGATVKTIPLYTTHAVPLTAKMRTALTDGSIDRLYFKSPSGVHGLLSQLRGALRKKVLGLRAECIGSTTAEAARKAGFKQVSIKKV
jgi:uroporphyrinogen-III synthase